MTSQSHCRTQSARKWTIQGDDWKDGCQAVEFWLLTVWNDLFSELLTVLFWKRHCLQGANRHDCWNVNALKWEMRRPCSQNIMEPLCEHENIGSLSCRLCDMHALICMDCINCQRLGNAQGGESRGSIWGTCTMMTLTTTSTVKFLAIACQKRRRPVDLTGQWSQRIGYRRSSGHALDEWETCCGVAKSRVISVQRRCVGFRGRRKSAQKEFCKKDILGARAIRGRFVEWWATRKTDCNKIPETFVKLRRMYVWSLNFV